MNTSQWWNVSCTACRWSNTRRGTEAQVTRHGCGRCGAPVNAAPGSGPSVGLPMAVPGT